MKHRHARDGRVDPRLVLIVAGGVLMMLVAASGGALLALRRRDMERLVLPLVALAAGALVGGALFHLLPESVERMDGGLAPFVWTGAGFVAFLALEEALQLRRHHLRHHRRAPSTRPLGTLLLVADSAHNLVGGLAVGTAFVTDLRLGVIAWSVAAAHELPEELGDFAVLLHSGWSPMRALAFNVASASLFLVGGVAAYAVSTALDLTFLLAFAAGNFLYIGASDLVPELTHHRQGARRAALLLALFLAGAGLLLAFAIAAPH